MDRLRNTPQKCSSLRGYVRLLLYVVYEVGVQEIKGQTRGPPQAMPNLSMNYMYNVYQERSKVIQVTVISNYSNKKIFFTTLVYP